MSKQTAPPLQQHAVDSSTSIPSISTTLQEDTCALLNDNDAQISIGALANLRGCNLEQCSATSPSSNNNEGLNHHHSMPSNTAADHHCSTPSNVAADSTSTPAREGSSAIADSTADDFSNNAAENPLKC